MQKLIYENERGERVELTSSRPFFLQKIDGIGGLKNNIIMQKSPFQDGSTITNKTLENRDITLEGTIVANNREELMKYRSQLLRIFNKKFKGSLTYSGYGVDKKIDCEVEYAPHFSADGLKTQKFLINLLCNNPFWVDDYKNTQKMSAFIPKFRFPLKFPFKMGGQGDRVVIQNNGDVETPLQITFKGACLNPIITNETTNKFIKINKKLKEGDVLFIDTQFGNKRVEINGENNLSYIDFNSSFFDLKIGENIINYKADSGANNAQVLLEWENRYLGI